MSQCGTGEREDAALRIKSAQWKLLLLMLMRMLADSHAYS